MAEAEQRHRHTLERESLECQNAERARIHGEVTLGQVFGFIIAIAAIGCGTYAAVQGAHWPGAIIGGGGLTGLVVAFIKARQPHRQPVVGLPERADGARPSDATGPARS